MLPNLLECIHDSETQIGEPDLHLPIVDQSLDNLERQGFGMTDNANTWI